MLNDILNGRWPNLLQSIEMGHSLISWGHNSDESYQSYIRSIVSCIIATAPKRNNPWISLAVDQLGVLEDLL